MKKNFLLCTLLLSSWALFSADAMPSFDIGQHMLEETKDPNAINEATQLPIIFLTFSKYSSPQTLKKYLDAGANTKILLHPNKDNLTTYAALNNYPEHLKILLDHGEDIDVRNIKGTTPLMTAAFYGNTNIVKILLERGANVNAQDPDGNTALIHAIVGKIKAQDKKKDINEHLKIIDLLMENPHFDPTVSPEGKPLPIWALANNDYSLLQSLCLKYPNFLLEKYETGETILEFLKKAQKNGRIRKQALSLLQKKAQEVLKKQAEEAAEAAAFAILEEEEQPSFDDLLAEFAAEDIKASAKKKKKKKKTTL